FELIGVLLPRSGNFTDAAEKVLRGLLIAHYDYMQKFPNSSIRVYDTELQGVEAAYQRAIADGADALVGPLEKEQLNALLKSTDIQIPMVALNYSSTTPPSTQNTYLEFGLRAEDEAVQLAQFAKAQGYRRAVAMAPETELGSRLNQAFKEEFERQGGTVLDSVSYDKNYKLLSDKVQNILSLQDSDKRHKALQSTLNIPISFQPKIRQDADFLALFALPIEARQIKPMIDFYYGQELPILSSSHIYSGVTEPSANADLNHITFVDIPWVLANQEVLTQTFGENLTDHNQYSRLNALGIDAHLILQHYPQIKSESNFGLQGATGYLSLSNHHQIKRQMSWAQFRKGVAVLLEEQPQVTPDVMSEQQHKSVNPVAPIF
ncbi:MAG: penicillin-binding protein activator, partial [Pseudomonadota bacterium]